MTSKIYDLEFATSALKEWKKLDPSIRDQFKKKLRERLKNPCVVASLLTGMPDCYKIKLKSSGYRLVYKVEGDKMVVLVLKVGRRDSSPYEKAKTVLLSLRPDPHGLLYGRSGIVVQ